jgi:hypothetical protein
MSFSAELPDWAAFSERETLPDVEVLSPAAEMAALLQRYRSDIDSARSAGAEAHRELLLALAQQAVYTVQLEAALDRYEPALQNASLAKIHRHLRVLKDQMLAGLMEAGLEIVRLGGRSYDEVADAVRIDGWRHHADYATEQVVEEVEPLVRYEGRPLRTGRVVMGAPPGDVADVTLTAPVVIEADDSC